MRGEWTQGSVSFNVESLEGRQMLAGEPWSWQAKMIGLDQATVNYPTISGKGQTIVFIDSGIDYNHPSLGGGYGSGKKVIAGYDFIDNDADPFCTTNAHGTGVAGIAIANPYVYKGYRFQGIAPQANVIALRENSTAGVKNALEWVLANRTRYNIVAVNMLDFQHSGASTYSTVLKSLIGAGVFVSHPAGNGGAGAPMIAQVDAADFSAGSVNSGGTVSSFSQRGPELDLLAPGEKVTLPYYDVASGAHNYVDTADGTSYSSPTVVAAAALIKQVNPKFTPGQIMQIMQDSGKSVYDATSTRTYKLLNVNAALALAYQRSSSTTVPPTTPPTVPPTPPPTTPQTPAVVKQSAFKSVTIASTGDTIIEAENFDNGGEGVSYHDTEAANLGKNNYRPGLGVDIESSSTGGRDVASFKTGEWLEYTVNVATAGVYTITTRVASQGAGGKFHIEVDGADKTGQLSIGDTGGWQKWGNVTRTGVSLGAGGHVIRFKADAVGSLGYLANVDSIKFTRFVAPPKPSLPFTVQAASFAAQRGIASSGRNISYLDQGDYVMYKGLDFGGTTGLSRFSVNIMTKYSGNQIQIRLGSPTGRVIGTLTTQSTGQFARYQVQTTRIEKTTGVHDVYLTFVGRSVGAIQWIKFG